MNETIRDPGCLLTGGWRTAAGAIRPALVPAAADAPIVTHGPAGLAVAYVLVADGAEVPVSEAHLRSWGVSERDVQAAGMGNLASWSDSAGWVDETEAGRRLLWSDWGDGMDAARILLACVRRRLATELGSQGRVLVAMPERDLLIATAAPPADREYEALFADYVAGRLQAADRPLDSRVFELRDGELIATEIVPD
jgi:uncharacterized protein YtpQ (UPF0354 family)